MAAYFRELWEKMKPMTWRERLDYIWYYYKWVILGAIGLLWLFGAWLHNFVTYQDPALRMVLLNSAEVQVQPDFGEFFETYDYRLKNEDVRVTPISLVEDDPLYAQSRMSLMLQLTLDQDIFIGQGEGYEEMAEMGVLMDLRHVLPEDTLTVWEENLLYSTSGGEEEPYPCAVWLENEPWLTAAGYPDGCWFGIAGQASNMDITLDFADYLLNG